MLTHDCKSEGEGIVNLPGQQHFAPDICYFVRVPLYSRDGQPVLTASISAESKLQLSPAPADFGNRYIKTR
jgi:hypothetical protein